MVSPRFISFMKYSDLLNTLLNFFKFVVKKLLIVFCTKLCIACGVEPVKSGSRLKVVVNTILVVTGSTNSVSIHIRQNKFTEQPHEQNNKHKVNQSKIFIDNLNQ